MPRPVCDAVGHEVDRPRRTAARVELGERRGPAHEREEVVGAPLLRAGLGDDLLREDVERQARELDGVERARVHRGEERGALDELVARQREEPALRRAGAAVVGAADPLEERGDAARRADLAHELDRADVDAELERRGGDERPQVAGAQPGLDPVAAVLRQAAVVRGDDVVAEALAELVGEPLGEPAGVHEHERGAVLADELGDAVEHVAHLLGRRDRFELAFGQLEREVEVRAGGRRRRSRAAGGRRRAGAPTVSIGRCVAESPTRCGALSHSASSRSSVSARCAPRLSRATAWISSTMTVSTVRSSSRPFALVTSR